MVWNCIDAYTTWGPHRFGSQVPFIFRKCDSIYRIISNCYVQGLMDGEAIDMWKAGELESEQFKVR